MVNEGHYLELMDRLHVICNTIDTHIVNHPLTLEEKELYDMVEEAQTILVNVYQRVGQLDHERNYKGD